jgi:hypothetical protein
VSFPESDQQDFPGIAVSITDDVVDHVLYFHFLACRAQVGSSILSENTKVAIVDDARVDNVLAVEYLSRDPAGNEV